MELFWLKHAAFKIITSKGLIIYLDPYKVSDNEEKADIIICSHEHFDHFDEKSIKKLLKESTKILGPKSISEKLRPYNGIGVELNNKYNLGDIIIEFVPAYNIKRIRPGTNEPFHPKYKGWAGSIIEVENKKIYHAGDTERIPEMKELRTRSIDVALLPSGGTYTMDFEESTDCAVEINPKIVIPMHNWDKDMTGYKSLLNEKNPNIDVKLMSSKGLKL